MAESLALALVRESEYKATAMAASDAAVLAEFAIVLIEAEMEAALQLSDAITLLNPRTKVILLGLNESEANVVKMAEVGGSGYVKHTTSFLELVAVMRSVEKGEFSCTPAITYALFSHLTHLERGRQGGIRELAVLTARQRQVLACLSMNLSNKEIAGRLCLSQHTVKNHVHHILKKLGMQDRRLRRPVEPAGEACHALV